MKRCDYHDFQVESSDDVQQVEVCIICGERKRYKIVNQRVNNTEYLKDHARDFAQPGGASDKVFQKFYGKK